MIGIVKGVGGDGVREGVMGIEEEKRVLVKEIRMDMWNWMGVIGRGCLGNGMGRIEGFDIEKVGCDGLEEMGMGDRWDGIEGERDGREEGKWVGEG